VRAAAEASCVTAAAAMLRERTGRHDRRHGKGAESDRQFSNQTRTFHNVTRSLEKL
jgi:hypothetical protein